jgi:uncharacterized protein YdeI (YjbR/CyaY-like superfamily)
MPSNTGPRGFSEEKFLEKTGRTIQEWEEILDDWNADVKGHTATAKFLQEVYDVDDWWAQSITVRYEYDRNLRTAPSEPQDLVDLLRQHPDARAMYKKLAPSHKKEYWEWITSAKKPETREKRLQGTIDKLLGK